MIEDGGVDAQDLHYSLKDSVFNRSNNGTDISQTALETPVMALVAEREAEIELESYFGSLLGDMLHF